MKECLNCTRLGVCLDTDVTKLLAHFVCPLWEEVKPAVVSARYQAIQQFGNTGAKALVTPEATEEK